MADERVNLSVDINVKGERSLTTASAKLLAFEQAAKRLEARTDRLTGRMNSLTAAMNKGSKSAQKFRRELTLFEKVGGAMLKMARLIMFTVIAIGIEFAISALSIASVNAAFAVGKFAMQAYNYGMQALAGTLAAVGAAAIGAAAAFREFQAAQFQFRYKDSKELGSALDQSSFGLRSLYKDATLATFGVQALAGAFVAVGRNAAFTPATKAALKAMADFAQASGDPAKSLQAAASFVSLLQKEKKFTAEALAAAQQISPEFDKAFKKGSYKNMEKFMEDLLSGKLAAEAGVLGQSDAISKTLFGQFKAYLSQALVELSDVGQRVLEPIKKAMFDIYGGLERTFRRVSNDLVSFGRGPFLNAFVQLTYRLEDFTVVMFRKFLPATEGFWRRTSNFFKDFAVYFREVRDALQPLRDGGSIVIKTFGKPIVEIFRQIGESVKALDEQAVKYKDRFLAFGEALKSVVQGFFEISRAVREAFAQAMPLINPMLRGLATFLKLIGTIITGIAATGPLGGVGIIGGLGALAYKGRRAARFERRRGIKTSADEMIYSGKPLSSFGGADSGAGLGSLSGAMANATSSAMAPAASSLNAAGGTLSGAGGALSGAASALTVAATTLKTSAPGKRPQMPLRGGRAATSNAKATVPGRPPGMSVEEYNYKAAAWKQQEQAAHLRTGGSVGLETRGYKQGTPGVQQYDAYGNPLTNIYGRPLLVDQQRNDLLKVRQMTKAEYKAMESAKRLEARKAANLPTGPHTNLIQSPQGRYVLDQRKSGNFMVPSGVGLLSGRMASGAKGARNRLMTMLIGNTYGTTGYEGFRKTLANQIGMAEQGAGGTRFARAITGLKGGNFGRGYRQARQNFLDAQKEGLISPDKKFSRLKGLRAGARASFSGGGIATSLLAGQAIDALSARGMVSQEAAGGLQVGAGLMSINPLLGVAIGAGLTAFSSKTKKGGLVAGAVSGAAVGAMIAGPLGATVGSVVGAGIGALAADRNQKKMVKQAMKDVSLAQLSGVAAEALKDVSSGGTERARAMLKSAGQLSKKFKAMTGDKATTPERLALLQPFVDAGVLSGNALSLATGDKNELAAEEIAKSSKVMEQALLPAFDQFDSIMKALKQSTGMASQEIFKLAMERNVDLYDTTLTLSDAVAKLGVGMIKTAQQFGDALRDVQVSSLDVFRKFKQTKEMKDVLQAAGETLRSGDTSTEAFLDYYTKSQDLANYLSPSTPLTNFIANAQRFGTGANVGKGSLFGAGGPLAGITMGAEATGLVGQAQKQAASGAATTMTTQIGAMLASSGFQFSDVDAGTKAIETKLNSMISSAMAGDSTALATLTKLEGDLARGTALKGKSPQDIAAYFNSIFGTGTGAYAGGPKRIPTTSLFGIGLEKELSGQLDPFKDILSEEARVMREEFTNAIKTGFMSEQGRPVWWDQAPSWWTGGFEAQLNNNGQITKLVPIGDTAESQVKKTMGKHGIFNKMIPGNRKVTSSLRNFALGSQNSDHATGHAYDLIGSNLNQYAGLVNASGGFAEFHGSGQGRHLHVVPPIGPIGDTSSSMLAKMSGGTTTYAGDTYNINVNGAGDPQVTARAVAQEILKMQRNWKQRS